MINVKIDVSDMGNENHRDQLIKDMIYVCCIDDLSDKSRKEFLDKAVIWPLSDRGKENIYKSAKYRGCTYWSKEAFETYLEPFTPTLKGFNESGLKHEHVIPKRIFITTMMDYFKKLRDELKNTAKDDNKILNKAFIELKEHISKKIFACVVTDNEDRKKLGGKLKDAMPDGCENFFEITDPWLRYKKAGFTELYEVEWKSKKDKRGNEIKGWEYVSAHAVKIEQIKY